MYLSFVLGKESVLFCLWGGNRLWQGAGKTRGVTFICCRWALPDLSYRIRMFILRMLPAFGLLRNRGDRLNNKAGR